ncbi:MAG: hypothetical protein ACODAB_08030 [Gemmatimonadota bacterium]
MTHEIRCGKCSHWLGEAPEPLVYVEHVGRSTEARVEPPRDLRLCKSCGRVNVFVARTDLGERLGEVDRPEQAA